MQGLLGVVPNGMSHATKTTSGRVLVFLSCTAYISSAIRTKSITLQGYPTHECNRTVTACVCSSLLVLQQPASTIPTSYLLLSFLLPTFFFPLPLTFLSPASYFHSSYLLLSLFLPPSFLPCTFYCPTSYLFLSYFLPLTFLPPTFPPPAQDILHPINPTTDEHNLLTKQLLKLDRVKVKDNGKHCVV